MKVVTSTLILAAATIGFAGPIALDASEEHGDSGAHVDSLDEEKQKEIEKLLIERYGISSTGNIKLSRVYRLTHDEDIGSPGNRIALFTQEDLLGERLFWICLVNLESEKTIQLYRTGLRGLGGDGSSSESRDTEKAGETDSHR